MDKIKTVKIKNEDGTVSEESYSISVDAMNVDMSNGKELQETIGTIDIDIDGNIAEQLENLNNNVNDLNIDIKKKAYFFDTIEDMKNAKLKEGDMAITLGYYEPGDGGGAEYNIIKMTNNDIVDNMLILSISTDSSLIAKLIVNNSINLKVLGAKNSSNNINDNDIKNYLIKAYENFNEIIIPSGEYYLSEFIPNCVGIQNKIIRGTRKYKNIYRKRFCF